MKDKHFKYIVIGVVVAVIAGAGLLSFLQSSSTSGAPGQLDDFAKCLADSGAKFYGAFWCPHCQATKKMFGNSAKYLPYVECSTTDGNGQLPVCTAQKIQYYPTWTFADGSQDTGEVTLQYLAEKTGCALPQ